jgi:hypothetical protein
VRGTANLLDSLSEGTRREVAFDAQGSRDHEGIFGRRMVEHTDVQSARDRWCSKARR